MKAYKLFRLRPDGSIGPLFVERDRVLIPGEWHQATMTIVPKSLKTRPGWHVLSRPEAPHICAQLANGEVRQMWEVEIEDFHTEHRPPSQGGKWYLAKQLKLIRPV